MCNAQAEETTPSHLTNVDLYDHNDTPDIPSSKETPEEDGAVRSLKFLERRAVSIANRPCTYLWTSLLITIVLSLIGMIVGKFTVSVEGDGWLSRGTLIADRHTQFLLIWLNRKELFLDRTGEVWEDLITNVQPSWFAKMEEDKEGNSNRRLGENNAVMEHSKWSVIPNGATRDGQQLSESRRLPFTWTPTLRRKLQEQATASNRLAGCDISWYETDLTEDSRLWPIWRPKAINEPNVLLREDVLRDLCLSEEATQRVLVEQDLCYPCDGGGCLPPYSIVLFARLTVPNGMDLECNDLAVAWTRYVTDTNPTMESDLVQCTKDLELNYKLFLDTGRLPASCPEYFFPSFVDDQYSSTSTAVYTSTIFATKSSEDDLDALFDVADDFDRGTMLIEGAYDTQNEDFVFRFVDSALGKDMSLALASAFITLTAMLLHTRSPFLTLIGLLQIVLSFPLAYFVYTFMGQLDFFPFLNFLGIFVVFALGADVVFVAVDKWKNARLAKGWDVPVADIAIVALPDAANAMFLTTLTTAVAFFGTAICPVAPIKMFAIFCGLLIVLDYILCVALVFPALCIYDQGRYKKSCCLRCRNCCPEDVEKMTHNQTEDNDKPSLIRRILTAYYVGLHSTRYVLLVACLGAFTACAIFASRLDLPTTSDVRILDGSNEFERSFEWRQNILYDVIERKSGSSAYVIWGTIPADTGDRNNPDSFSQLVLDKSFEPSKTEAQIYLRDFCPRFFATEYASPIIEGEACPINRFDEWLQEQATAASPDQIYLDYCGGATGLPMSEENFDACVFHWGQREEEVKILARDGKVRVMYIQYSSRVRFDSPFDDLDREWNAIEAWFTNERTSGTAPRSVSGMFFTSEDYWWYDTNGRMLNTAIVGAAIALATSAAVIFLSSRSLVLTIFSSFTIGYVLLSVTALLVSLGWTLGFLEAICFAILIGLSCDFVIHFSHAYTSLEGDVDRFERTKYALIQMGPSILAAGATSMASATVMLFTVITFFVKFGLILLVTIVQATVGSFVVFLVLTDCFGPTHPTYMFDLMMAKIFSRSKSSTTEGDTSIAEKRDKLNATARTHSS